MCKALIAFVLMFVTAVSIAAQVQFNKPEHVVYDAENRIYLVTNYGDGRVVACGPGIPSKDVITGIESCLGIHLVDDLLLVTAGDKIGVYDKKSFEFLRQISHQVSNWMDGMADDGKGNLYAAENSGKIHKIDLATGSSALLVDSGLPKYPQDLAWDPVAQRLLLVCWEEKSPIVAIDPVSGVLTELIATRSGRYDGIALASNRDIYVSSWMQGGRILRWKYPYQDEPDIVSEGHAGPAGLALNESGEVLAIPNFNSNSIDWFSLATPDCINEEE